VTITAAQGASYDGDRLIWFCPSGQQFFAGTCSGPVVAAPSGYRLPGAPNGGIVMLLGSTYYDLSSPVTIPGGVSLVQPQLYTNYDPAAPTGGDLTIGVQVCNNATANWTHTFDFKTSSGGFLVPSGVNGQWVAGVGWQSTTTPAAFVDLDIRRAYASSSLTSFHLEYHWQQVASGAGASIEAFDNGTPGLSTTRGGDTATGDYTLDGTGTSAGSTQFEIRLNEGSVPPGDGLITLTTLVITGVGVDPF
jgi:hypothetical protein